VLDDLDGPLHDLDLLNNPCFFRSGAHRTAAVRTTVQTVLAHLVDLVTGKGRTLVFRMTRLAADLAFGLLGRGRLRWLDPNVA
jgi:hypothetical protein